MCENGSECKETVDPRVHIELERLNSATDEINRLEVDLDEARASFRQLLCDSTARVDQLRLKLGMCVERSKPYYEARYCANEALKQTQIAAMRYERGNSAHSAAREMVYLAEQGLGGRTLDPAWQEMLNHATQRVNDSEVERSVSETEHRLACMKHEAANMKVKNLQKELKRAIAKSRPYYEMKAHFNHLLEQQKCRVQNLETKVSTAKLTYADALKNLEQISDEIHQTRNKSSAITNSILASEPSNAILNGVFQNDIHIFTDDYKNIPQKLNGAENPIHSKFETVEGYKDLVIGNNISPSSTKSESELSENIEACSIMQSHSGEWTEINLEVSSPEDEPHPTVRGNSVKPKLQKQKTLPNPSTEREFSSIKGKIKLDTNISNWISRSSAKSDAGCFNNSRRQSLDNLLGPTSEKVKEILSQGMMMLNISSLAERRNSEPKAAFTEENSKTSVKKIPSPLEKTLAYLGAEEDNSDTESVSSVEMLNDDQISSLMLDKAEICEQVLGTPISEIVNFP